MARPKKEGMDYFPHDTDAVNDEKIEALRYLYGNDGYAFYFILLERIYRTKNFELDVSDAETIQILSRKVGVNEEKFHQMLETSLKRGCFDKQAYEESHVLTSEGIKKRASVVVEKRVKMRDKYQSSKDSVSDAETTQETEVETPQSKEKESKEKKRKEDIYANEFAQFWLIYPRKLDKKKALAKFKTVRKNHSLETILEGTKKYAQQVKDTDKQFIKHPSTFLNNESFVDGYEEAEKPKPRPIIVEQTESPIAAFWE
jgi:spore germination protein YaaH